MNIDATECRSIWVIWQNTDLTEGKGCIVPVAWCDSESTAKRLAKGKDVQGCDCHVTQEYALKVQGRWFSAVNIELPTERDTATDQKLLAARAAEKKAREAGLTEQEINSLRQAAQ